MNAIQYAIARVAEQYRQKILWGQFLTPREWDNNEFCRAAVMEYERLEDPPASDTSVQKG